MKKFIFAGLLLASTSLFADHVMTVTSESKNLRDYVPPMLANGAISTRVDNLGQQVQKKYINCYPDVAWAGRRYAYCSDLLRKSGSSRKAERKTLPIYFLGGKYRARTCDPLLVRQMLSQLS